MKSWIEAQSEFGKVVIDPAIGNIRQLSLFDHDRELTPLACAPWVGEYGRPASGRPASGRPESGRPESMALVERNLCGDFLCAPFGHSDIEPGPIHGLTANSQWQRLSHTAASVEFELQRKVFGATIKKTLTLSSESPLLYQRHQLVGGDGKITLAHHPMVKLAGRGKFCCSPKQIAIAAENPLEAGRNRLLADGTSEELKLFPGSDGGTLDLTDLPIGTRHEDFVTLVEQPDQHLGWSAIIREVEDDIVFFIKDPSVLPVTMLWHSNAGRDYAPWNGRHTGVLGVEDGCAAGTMNHSEAIKENRFTRFGIPTAIELGGDIHIGHVTGAMARPSRCNEITDIRIENGVLKLSANNGVIAECSFDQGIFDK